MNQLGNSIITDSIVKQHQNELLNARDHQRASVKTPQRSLRGTIGSALIRFGESIRGRSETLTPAEADHNLAYHLPA